MSMVKRLGGGRFLQAPTNRAGGNGAHHRRDTAILGRLGFRRRKDAPGSLVQVLGQGGITLANRGDVDHPRAIPTCGTGPGDEQNAMSGGFSMGICRDRGVGCIPSSIWGMWESGF
jgi:hypothetical protein